MTQAAQPMTKAEALLHLQDALGENYAGPVDEGSLQRALAVDSDGDQFRPWATAARLIKFNTEYEVNGDLRARVDRKLAELEETQRGADMARKRSGMSSGPTLITWGDRL